MSMRSRREVVNGWCGSISEGGAPYRRKRVDELCSVCGYERKCAIKVLNGSRPGPRGLRRGGGPRVYDERVARVVAAIWKPADYPCGTRLAAMMPLWLPAYEARQGPLEEALRARVLHASPATLDRL